MRPHEEIARLVEESIEIKITNPNHDFTMIEKIDEGGFGAVFKVKRKSDQNIFAMKLIKGV